ncbi:MAG: RHS repeat protein [Gemmatimonadetes bacterium]|nr:RHS repeat protein [Gemmatimonadota bacterium]
MRLRLSWLSVLLLLLAFLTPGLVPSFRRALVPAPAVPGTVIVTPDGGTLIATAHAAWFRADFTVLNTRTLTSTYTLACSYTGQVTGCFLDSTSETLAPDEAITVHVYYQTGNLALSGNTITLTASGPATDAGYYGVRVQSSMIAMVTPGGTQNDAVVTVRRHQPALLARFLLSPGYATDSATIGMTWQRLPAGPVVTVTNDARRNRGLIEWEVEDSLALQNPGDSARATVTHCTTGGVCTEERRIVKLANDSKPILGFSGVPTGSLAAGFGAPFGQGIAVSGVEIETGFGTVPYFSMGQARSAGLVYSTRQAWPRVTIPVDVELPWLGANPSALTLIAWDGAYINDSVRYTAPACVTGAVRKCRGVITADFRTSSFATPMRKWLKIEARVVPAGGGAVVSATDSVEVALVDRRTTRYGAGWWPAGALRLVAAGEDRLLVGADGAVTVFRGNGDSLYLPPPGNFSVLKKVGTTWELAPRGSLAKLVFDAQGRLVKRADQNGNRDTLLYGGTTDSLLELRDPLDKRILLGYASGKLSTFTTLHGTGVPRTHAIIIDAATNQLTRDSIGGAPYRTIYRYAVRDAATKTQLLGIREGMLGDSTQVVYDSSAAGFLWRPGAVRLPRVPDETGALVRPQITYTAVLRRGAGTVVPLDSTGPWVEMRDPRGNWTRSWLTRWGQARYVWDTLGALSRARYTTDGRVVWSEARRGGDTTRVYSAYDSQQRLVKSWTNTVTGLGQGVRLDSLVYDASHRVIVHVDSRGKADSVFYDAKGNVIKTKDPSGAVTQFWYSSTTGQLDSMLPPSTTARQRYTYDATWKNPTTVSAGATTAGSVQQSQSTYDSYGRVASTLSRVQVRVTGSTVKWQWRKTVPTYVAATNEVTTQTSYRSDTCDPCVGGPASWPSDSFHVMTVSVFRDAAGRDTARVGERGYQTVYTYDRLGRLLARRPPSAGGPAPRDSMVYDVAGNIVKTYTRRGDLLTATYDSRNRLLTQVVPGIGTINRTYAGPLDQLTRVWVTGAVDSIGGVNGEVRYGFDARGHLLADTAYRNATALVTTYTRDQYDRDSVVTDPVGAWRPRYETARGIPERLVTPLGDSVSLTLDGQQRPAQRTVLSSGPAFTQSVQYLASSGAAKITQTAGASGYEVGTYDPEGAPDEPTLGAPLGPIWVEQHGPSPLLPDTLVDSLSYDGWGRLLGWQHFRKADTLLTLLASDSVWFDRTGNVHVNGETRTHELQTDRLLTRVAGAWTWSYTYDAGGNLTQASGTTLSQTITWTYQYDAANQLRSVRYRGHGWGADSLVARYGYDVLGRRIARRVYWSPLPGAEARETRYLYQGGQVVAETDAAGAFKWKYTWGPGTDNLVGLQDSTGTQFYVVQDQLGSVRGLVRRDGTWIMSQRFTPAGQLLARDSVGGHQWPKGLHVGWTGRGDGPRDGAQLPPGAVLQPGASAVDAGGPDRVRRRGQPVRLRGRGGAGGAGSERVDRGPAGRGRARAGGVVPSLHPRPDRVVHAGSDPVAQRRLFDNDRPDCSSGER